jgi:hypothetical protein
MCIGIGMIIRWVINPPFNDQFTIWTNSNIIVLFCGTMLLATGVFFIIPLYKFPDGILLNPKWVAKFYDFITVSFGSAAAILVIDALLLKIFNTSSIINDDYLTFMSIFFYSVGVPMLAAYTCRLTYQAIQVDHYGIRINNASGTEKILWDDIKSMELSEEYVLVGRMGSIMPRELQKGLKINTKMGGSFYINEPQLKRKKKEVIRQLKDHMPQQFRASNTQILDQW